MDKNVKRCRIWISLWRVDELEAWFSEMAAQGWALKSIEEQIATFERAEPINRHFFCLIYDQIKQKKEISYDEKTRIDKENRENQRAAFEQAGWQFIADDKDIAVFRSDSFRHYPIDPERKCEKIVALYKRTDGKLKIRWDHISTFSMSVLFCLVFGIFEVITQGSEYMAIPLFLYGLCSILFQIVRRYWTLRRIRSRFDPEFANSFEEKIWPERCRLRNKRKEFIKWIASILAFVLLMLPALPGLLAKEAIYGYPLTPAGPLPVMRIGDLDVSQMPNGPSDPADYNITYKAYPGPLLLMQYQLHEDSENSGWLESDRYDTIAPWFAGLLAQSAANRAFLKCTRMESGDLHGFNAVWTDSEDDGSITTIVAIKESTVYLVTCTLEGITPDELLSAMEKKAGQ